VRYWTGADILITETIEARAAADPPSAARFEEWQEVWEKCTRLEKSFWDMALDLL
jgi:hydroxymethylpyrimidine/phosphomethylpyrimidine kinase / thiaminase